MGTDILVKNDFTVGILQPPKNIPCYSTLGTLRIASFTVPIYGGLT
jgi:hypothetical protein